MSEKISETMFSKTIREMLQEGRLQKMDAFMQHGTISTLDHSLIVAYYSWRCNAKFHLHGDEVSVIRGAILHDYFLYDWHEKQAWHRWHGFRHPSFALDNAKKDFHLNAVEEEIIKKHMWPLTLIPPLCREAWIVNFVDSISSIAEVLMQYPRFHALKRFWYERIDEGVLRALKADINSCLDQPDHERKEREVSS